MMDKFKNKVYAYENSNGDKGIIIAKNLEKAKQIFKKEYPNRKIADNDADYWNNGSYLFHMGIVKTDALYNAFPW